MQIHPKAYLQRMWRLWHFRVLPPEDRDPATRDASPMLICIVVVLATLLAILEVDHHRALLQSFGLLGDPVAIDPIFMSP